AARLHPPRAPRARDRAGSAVDPFTGTASVASELKRLGFRVVASDIMEYAYVFGRAYVEVAAEPSFDGLAPEIGSAAKGLDDVVAYLNRIPPERSEEHTSELQSRENLVCRLLLEK